MYCGDETGSFVGDIGSYVSRFGYGGNDCPTYVVPSYVATLKQDQQKQQQTTTTTTTTTTTSNNKSIKKCIIPSTCYNPKWSNNEYCDFCSPLRNAYNHNEQQEHSHDQPILDPNLYLQQGDSIENWDEYEYMWQSAFNTLYVNDKYKHTKGTGIAKMDNSNNNITAPNTTATTTISTSGLTSKTIRPNDIYEESDSKCIHPVLVVSPGCTYRVQDNNDNISSMKQHRKELIEITEMMMETFNINSIFIAPSPMLCSFAHGRQTSLIVNIGSSGTCVTPIVDGIILKQSQRRNGRGGDYISNIQWYLTQQQLNNSNIILQPRYQLSSSYNHLSSTNRNINGLFHRWSIQDLMYELRTSLSDYIQLSSTTYNNTNQSLFNNCHNTNNNTDQKNQQQQEKEQEKQDDSMDIDPQPLSSSSELPSSNTSSSNTSSLASSYQLPDGTVIDLSSTTSNGTNDLCYLPELLFMDHVPFQHMFHNNNNSNNILLQHSTLSNLPLHRLIHNSLSAVSDVDIRKELMNSIIITGGTSLLSNTNFEKRLSYELNHIISSSYNKYKLICSKNHIERINSSWIGGSILTSLGSFQQLWLSRNEYNEYGAALSIQRFP